MRLIRQIERRLGIPASQMRSLAHFVLLGFTIMAAQAIGMTLGRSLFLAEAGAENLPLFFIIMPLVLMSVSAGFTNIIDRFNRPRLFRVVLWAAAGLIIGIRLLIPLDWVSIYFILYILIWLIYILQFRIEFWTLVADYFTTLELKRFTALISLGTTAGYLLGSILVGVISRTISLENQLLFLPVLYAIAIGQIYYLESRQHPLPAESPKPKVKKVKFAETWETLTKLSRHYPIAIFLVANIFGIALVRGIGEFEYSALYKQEFPDKQELAAFLGLVTAALTAIQFAIISFVTTPLIQKLGIARANWVYPLTLLGSFLAMGFSYTLTAAVGMQLTYRTLFYSIALPLTTLNYNAVPPRFGGRLRVWGEGLFSPLGQCVAGVVLMGTLGWMGAYKIVWLGVILSVGLVFLGYLTGKSYVRSLVRMVRSGSVNLNRVADGLRLPENYAEDVRRLLRDNEPKNQVLALELIANFDNPRRFIPDIKKMLGDANEEIRKATIRLFTTADMGDYNSIKSFLSCDRPSVRCVGLELCIALGFHLSGDRIQTLLNDENDEVRALACIATAQTGIDGSIPDLYHQVCPLQPDVPTRLAVVRAVGESHNPKLIPLLAEVLNNAPPEVKAEGLFALSQFADRDPVSCGEIAVSELGNESYNVRIAALQVLEKVRDRRWMPQVVCRLEDNNLGVRERAAKTASVYGNEGLGMLRDYLISERPAVVNTAIAAIARVRTKQAEDLLFEFMREDFQLLNRTRKWQQNIPDDDPAFELLKVAIADYQQRLLKQVFNILSNLGQESTVSAVQGLLSSADKRARANAVETLSSLRQGRFIRPLMPLLEEMATDGGGGAVSPTSPLRQYRVLLEALETRDRWLKIGALIALVEMPATFAQHDRDPLVRQVAESVVLLPKQLPIPENFMINRLLLLKNVSLFQTLSLDEILLIDRALEQEEYLAGEMIFAEGTSGERFYIIVKGRVRIVREVDGQERELRQLEVGQHFGEASLFGDSVRSANAIAAEHCVLLSLEKTRFISLVTQRPQILWEICKFLSQRLQETNQMVR